MAAAQPCALDLFCGAGGASMGLHRAGYEVVGVDLEQQPSYPFKFDQWDALDLDWSYLSTFDLIWASPPCQAFTAYKRRPDHVAPRPNLIAKIRKKLKVAYVPFVIENVPGAPLEKPIQLCGSSFGLDVRRHRLFETSWPIEAVPTCNHSWPTPRFPQATNRSNPRSTVEVGVWRIPLETQQHAMGIDWMTRTELSQAIPPAYAEFIGRRAMALERGAA